MKRKIDFIVIHCTATSPNASVQSIRNHWKNVMKWKNVGYHILIDAKGIIHELATFDKVTNGVAGHNFNSIHISYIGGVDARNKPKDTRTDEQKVSLLTAIEKAKKYSPNAKIQGHKDFPNVKKACPSFDAKNEYKDL